VLRRPTVRYPVRGQCELLPFTTILLQYADSHGALPLDYAKFLNMNVLCSLGLQVAVPAQPTKSEVAAGADG
jgi:hypothetical protein